MDLLRYTMEQVSYAIVEPSYAFILIMMAIVFYMKNKKSAVMEKMILGKNSISAFELTISQIVMGIIGGVLASIALTFLGVTFFDFSNIFIIFIISIGLMFFNPKLVCFSYSGAILGLISSMMYFLSLALEKPGINILKIDVASLIALVAVMHMVEGILVFFDGKRGAIPVFSGRDKKIIGGFAYKRQWILPMILLLMVQATQGLSGQGGVEVPQWWPLVNHRKNVELFLTVTIGALPIFAGLNYSTITFTKSKEKKPRFSGAIIFGYGAFLILLSALGDINPIMDVALLLIMPISHEFMLYIDRNSEKQGKVKYFSTEEGVCVLEVAPNSAAKKLGLKVGDLILEVNNVKVDRDEVVYNALERTPNSISFKVKRNNGEVKELLGKNIPADEKLGFIIVPRNLPNNVSVIKNKEDSFGDIFNKIKETREKKDKK